MQKLKFVIGLCPLMHLWITKIAFHSGSTFSTHVSLEYLFFWKQSWDFILSKGLWLGFFQEKKKFFLKKNSSRNPKSLNDKFILLNKTWKVVIISIKQFKMVN